jgi:hypothetical protein
MANQLLRARDASGVGKNWASSFVRRRPELRTRFSRKYDYQRAKCEDPKDIGEWFTLVQNVKAKYGIPDEDTYNFDETGFMMGMIFACMVVTTSDGRSKDKLAQPGNREWATVIQGVNAQGWAIPPFILAARYHLANWTPRAISRPTGSLQQSVSYEGHLSAVDPRRPREPPLYQQKSGSAKRPRMKARGCGTCGKPRHNSRTCQEAIELSDSPNSDVIVVSF